MRTLKLTIQRKDAKTQTVSIPYAAANEDLTEAKFSAFVDAYDSVLGGNVLETYTKAVVTTSNDEIIYPVSMD